MRRILILSVLLSSLFALPAVALPGIGAPYVGIGTHTYGGFPGVSNVNYGGTLELGIDDLLKSFGIGLRMDLPTFKSFDPAANIELRYSVFSVPFVRLLAGVFAGVQKNVGLDGTYGFFGAARFSLGLPYLGINLGAQGGNGYFTPYGQLTLGVVF